MAAPSFGLSARSTLAVLERGLTLYRRLWRASVFGSFVLPVLFLVSIGIGVGGHIGQVGGVSYLAWIVPGVMASTAFQMAVGECTYPILGDFKWTRGFHAMRATPVGVGDMVCGHLLYILIRVEIAVVVFLGVTALFGTLHSPWALVTPLVCALVTLAVAAPTMAFAASIDHDSYFALLFRFVMIPATLFSGVFFPVGQLPGPVRPLAYVSPLWHGVELNRAATLGAAPPWPAAAHLGYLLAFTAAGMAWALHAFGRRLQD
ncbi:transport permease protein [Sphaerisporangium krabiense]|uniref:Transport permease protein n=1 Tax=Sphaerisporangium krabiense TaxID=763782 RepID=A0A7W9DUU0_9ACTN|nr:ABC transporter permease [Sphaerisporangium krabiense]MBB5631404.1 lipooligosaccharide transport system permease protein [Sphaerisporangium krabiense]GII60822.1 transport permease protein [Sphaerisporangium krabiense]